MMNAAVRYPAVGGDQKGWHIVREEFGKDTGLTVRMAITMFLLGVVYAGFIYFLLVLGTSTAVMLIIVGILVGIQFLLSDKMILRSMRAKVVSEEEAPELHEIVGRLSQVAGVDKPRVAISDLPVPNAFAAGRSRSKTTVAVTTGLVDLLNKQELEAVIAHELTHVKNRDVVVMTIASFFSVVASTLMNLFFWMGLFGGFGGGRSRGGGGGVIMVAYFVTIIVWVLSLLLISALSRYREYSADRGAALITGKPADLVAALTRINGSVQRIPKNDLRKAESMNAFFILPAVGGSMTKLFSTHPPVIKRIERLQAMEQVLGA